MSGAELVPADSDSVVQVNRLREVCAWVMSASASEAFDTAEKAKRARAYVKAIDGAADIAREATRLECIAYRRVGQLKQVDLLPKGQARSIARRFAEMDDGEFEQWLSMAGPWSGCVGVYRIINRSERNDEMDRLGRAVGSGQAVTPVNHDSMHELVRAAAALLNGLTSEDVPFTVTSVADELAEEMGCSDPCRDTAPARQGYREAVRLALQVPPDDDCDAHPDAPMWVTYEEDVLGWVRVPFRTASLEQFGAMTALRRKQADQMDAVATRFERLHAAMRDAEEHFGEAPCGRLVWFLGDELEDAS